MDEIENEIVHLVGDNHTTPLAFNNFRHDEIHGIYTYEGKVCVLKGGYDLDFDQLTNEEQQLCLNKLKAENIL